MVPYRMFILKSGSAEQSVAAEVIEAAASAEVRLL